jgi:hypothetical protein
MDKQQSYATVPMEELVAAYIGPNVAHRAFRLGLANAKALAFVLARGDSTVLSDFLSYAAEQRKRFRNGDCAFGICGRGSTQTAIKASCSISGREVDLIETQTGGFQAQALSLIYREVHRIFETYLIDLFEEIALRDKRVLYSNHKISHEHVLKSDPANLVRVIIEDRKAELTRLGFIGLEKTFDAMGLPIVSNTPLGDLQPPSVAEQEEIRRRLIFISAARNVVEHNRSIVNREFVDLVPNSNYSIGDQLTIDITDLGDALWSVERAADNLNRRAIEKFGI